MFANDPRSRSAVVDDASSLQCRSAGLARGRRADAHRDVAELGAGARLGAFLLPESALTGRGDD